MNDLASTCVETSAPPAYGDLGRALAPLLEHLGEGCFYVYDDLRVAFLNAAARRDIAARGADPDGFPGEPLWNLLPYPPDWPARVAVEQAIRDRLPCYFTTLGTYGNYWVDIDVVPQEQGVLIYYRDVTPSHNLAGAQAASESALQATTARMQTLIDEAPLAVILLDPDLRIVHWNPASEAMFQWKAAEVVGRPLPTVPSDETQSFEANALRTLRGESLRAVPARRRRKDGVVLDVQISATAMRNAQDAITGIVVMISDVTAHRKLEAQLRMAQKMEAVGMLAGGVAHDFNNLLTAIKGFTSLLQMSVSPEDEAAEFLGEINKAADRAAALTAQLLAFSRRQLLRPEPIDLNARVRELERMLRLLLREDGNLVLDLDPALNKVQADPGQIEQVVLNLVVNARDALHDQDGGRVIIKTRNAELRDEFAHWGVQEAPGHYVRLDVIDNGIGMDRATQARIFDPFFTTKEPGHGTGLGLATVFGIVKQSNGYVWVESSPGEGASFTVYLPRASQAARTSESFATEHTGGGEIILLVEDEDAVRRVARRALELQGFRVVEASDGQTAVEWAEANHLDLLLTDVMMPRMSGTAVVSRIRQTKPGVKVLMMSGHSEELTRRGTLEPGTPFIKKPFTPAQLTQIVRDTLDAVPAD